jgi:hypothetical protein
MRYTAEPLEVSLVDHPCLPEATFAVIKADGSTELRKFKAGAADDGSALAHALAKIGARHSKADKDRIKQLHDVLTELDPDCCAGAHIPGANVEPHPQFSPQAGEHGDDAEAAKLVKVLAQRFEQPVAKAIHGMTARLDAMAARMKTIEDQPLPLGASSVRVVEKTEDSQYAAPEHVFDRPGALEAMAELAIRKAQAAPMRAMPGFKPRQV